MLFENLAEVLDPEPHGAALNMAIDEVLLRLAEGPLLRIYRWAQPAISFGYFAKVGSLAEPASGREMVRRWTGGGVVEHGRDITYTLIVPAAHAFARLSAAESYRRIHADIAALLGEQGTAAQLAPSTVAKISSGCFENPAEADVLAAGRKIAGAAQRRTRWGLLHQGSVQGVALAQGFAARLAEVFATAIQRRPLSIVELGAAKLLAEQKYATEAWLRRF
jgi:lipoate-protein ligase A